MENIRKYQTEVTEMKNTRTEMKYTQGGGVGGGGATVD